VNLDPHADHVPENPVDIQNVTIPSLADHSRYEDLWEIDAAEDLQKSSGHQKFKANLKRWYFRLN